MVVSGNAGLILLIAAVTVVRLAVAALIPLAPDETYYWVWSHALAFSYLDHPPMVALWIKAGTMLGGQTALGVRLLGPLAGALASWMLLDAGRVLFPGRGAGVVAVVLLNATLLLGVGTVIMTPDSPLLFFWTAALWAMAWIASGGGGVWWLLAGVFGGLALDSKYTALLFWVGVGVWTLAVPSVRPWLRRWQPWAACAIGFALFAPVLWWNAEHGWAGFVRQGGRVEDWRPARSVQFLGELAGGQIGLVTPGIWVLCMAGLAVAARRAWRDRDAAWSLLAALSLPAVLVFVQHAFGDRVQGNWPAIIYPALSLAAGGLAMPARWSLGAALLGFAMTGAVYVQAAADVFPVPVRFDPIALRLRGWDGLARQVAATDEASGAAFVAADGYGLASELAWWLPDGVTVLGTDERWRLTALPSEPITGRQGLLVRAAPRADPPDAAMWAEAERIGTVFRPGDGGAGFAVYRVIGLGEAAGLPGRR